MIVLLDERPPWHLGVLCVVFFVCGMMWENDLGKLERKMRNFKTLFPWFNDYKLYGAIASFHINEDAKKDALERGFFVLQRKGEVVQTDCSEHLMVL